MTPVTDPSIVLQGDTPPGWLARRMGRAYTETLDEVRDRLLVATPNVTFRAGPFGRQPYQLTRFLELRAKARARRSDLSCYGYTP